MVFQYIALWNTLFFWYFFLAARSLWGFELETLIPWCWPLLLAHNLDFWTRFYSFLFANSWWLFQENFESLSVSFSRQRLAFKDVWSDAFVRNINYNRSYIYVGQSREKELHWNFVYKIFLSHLIFLVV